MLSVKTALTMLCSGRLIDKMRCEYCNVINIFRMCGLVMEYRMCQIVIGSISGEWPSGL